MTDQPSEWLTLPCPHCEATLRLPVQSRGKTVKCKKCESWLPVPDRASRKTRTPRRHQAAGWSLPVVFGIAAGVALAVGLTVAVVAVLSWKARPAVLPADSSRVVASQTD